MLIGVGSAERPTKRAFRWIMITAARILFSSSHIPRWMGMIPKGATPLSQSLGHTSVSSYFSALPACTC